MSSSSQHETQKCEDHLVNLREKTHDTRGEMLNEQQYLNFHKHVFKIIHTTSQIAAFSIL